MLKKAILAVVLVIAIALVVTWFTGNQPRTVKVEDLPWQVEVQADGASRVFNVSLGQTSLDELSRRLNKVPEIAVFVTNEGPGAIEAYFGKIRLGIFDAKFVLMLEASPEMLLRVAENAGEPEPMPSGSWKRVVGEQDIPDVVNLPIREITYVPSVAYEPDLVEQRFGKPATVLGLDETSDYWLYPEKGLAILMNQDGKEILQYVHPAAFRGLTTRIEQEISAREASNAQQ
jgi:hypothetical protein